ncbi:ATP-binding protein [Azospirillum thermophilum]|uniref:ATP-binding protein n=1 Tax=Azospirillum thermophilum TaxID=2202148 RepID=UPI001FEA59E8|nr:ATP-binding protein [Azospirillum thermophilum]
MPRLFDPLVAGHDRSGRRGEGLGLAMVFAVLHGHEGGILIASKPGAGTLVRLFVPLAGAPAPLVPARGDPPHRAAAADGAMRAAASLRCRILLVDGDAASGDRLSAGLERLGHEVAVCESEEEALAVFAEEPAAFDVVAAAAGFDGLPARLKERHPGIACVLCGGPAPRVPGADLVLPAPVDVLLLGTRAAELAAARREGRA